VAPWDIFEQADAFSIIELTRAPSKHPSRPANPLGSGAIRQRGVRHAQSGDDRNVGMAHCS